ncbi:MAG: methyltransferase domain-containing protein, partial [Gaiellaceae bacterium]
VAALRRRFPGVESRETAAEDLPWADETFDSALAQLVVSFMNDAPAGVREMHRVVRRGGTVAVCMWDIERMEMLAAVDRTRDALGHPREAGRYRTRAEIEELMGPDAEIELLEVEGLYSDFEDFWAALAGGAGPAGAWAASLDDDDREVARAELYRQLGEPEGPFGLTGRAWAARVRRG